MVERKKGEKEWYALHDTKNMQTQSSLVIVHLPFRFYKLNSFHSSSATMSC